MSVVLTPLFAVLPEYIAVGLALVVADIEAALSKRSRKAVEDNLTALFGDRLGAEKRRRVTRDHFRVRLCSMADEARFLRGNRRLAPEVEFRGLEFLHEALSKGRGAVIGGAHFGPQRSCLVRLSNMGFPVSLLSGWASDRRSLRSRLVAAVMHDPFRRALGRRFIEVRSQYGSGEFGGTVRALRLLQSNGAIFSIIDSRVYPGGEGKAVSVDFLGREAHFMPGTMVLARTAGSQLFVALAHMTKDWRHKVLEVSPPVSTEGTTEEVYQRCISILEREIRRYPSHWAFFSTPGVVGTLR